MSHRPRSRKPSTWPRKFSELIISALGEELCVPFETYEKLQSFQELLTSFRRSAREWQHPQWEEINALRGVAHDTIDVCAQRGGYEVNTTHYPVTLILSPDLGFAPNIKQAVVPTAPTTLPRYYHEEEEVIHPSSTKSDEDEYTDMFKDDKNFGM